MAKEYAPTARERSSLTVPRLGEALGGKYIVEAELGCGAMGIVFAARNQLTGRRVALKWMLPRASGDEAALRRFLQEAKVAGCIDHPDVVTIYDVGFEGDAAFIVMELLQGELFSEVLTRCGRLSVAETLAVALPAMRGVEAAHARNVIHRDLKPGNIFVCEPSPEGAARVVVLDFGVSKVLADSGVQPALTATGGLVGTPHYMAPEQADAVKNLDARADVYALGVILYEALTGQRPFVGETYFELLSKIKAGGAPSVRQLVPALPIELDTIIARAMAGDCRERYESVAALRAALQPFASLNNELAWAQTVPQRARLDVPRPAHRSSKRLPTWAIALGGLLVGLVWLAAHFAMPQAQRTSASGANADAKASHPVRVEPKPLQPVVTAVSVPSAAGTASVPSSLPLAAAPKLESTAPKRTKRRPAVTPASKPLGLGVEPGGPNGAPYFDNRSSLKANPE